MNNSRFMFLVVFGVAFVVIGLAAFTVNEREVAIKLRVGQVVASDYEPGLHWKIPLYENVRRFSSRIMRIDDEPQRVFTLERTAMEVDYFVKWRIVDPVQFYTSTSGSTEIAEDRSAGDRPQLNRYRIRSSLCTGGHLGRTCRADA